jgi:hypothetical protein
VAVKGVVVKGGGCGRRYLARPERCVQGGVAERTLEDQQFCLWATRTHSTRSFFHQHAHENNRRVQACVAHAHSPRAGTDSPEPAAARCAVKNATMAVAMSARSGANAGLANAWVPMAAMGGSWGPTTPWSLPSRQHRATSPINVEAWRRGKVWVGVAHKKHNRQFDSLCARCDPGRSGQEGCDATACAHAHEVFDSDMTSSAAMYGEAAGLEPEESDNNKRTRGHHSQAAKSQTVEQTDPPALLRLKATVVLCWQDQRTGCSFCTSSCTPSCWHGHGCAQGSTRTRQGFSRW